MHEEPGKTLTAGGEGNRLQVDPGSRGGILSGEGGAGWAFDPLAHLRFTDRDGNEVPWRLETIGAGSGGPALVEAAVRAGRNSYRLSAGLDPETADLLLAIEPVDEPDPI